MTNETIFEREVVGTLEQWFGIQKEIDGKGYALVNDAVAEGAVTSWVYLSPSQLKQDYAPRGKYDTIDSRFMKDLADTLMEAYKLEMTYWGIEYDHPQILITMFFKTES